MTVGRRARQVLPESVAGDSERLARFRRVAEVLAALNHPHIAQIYGLEHSGGTTALVIELVEGHTLDEIIRASVDQRRATFDVMSWALPSTTPRRASVRPREPVR